MNLFCRETRRDVLRTVPIERVDPHYKYSLDGRLIAGFADALDPLSCLRFFENLRLPQNRQLSSITFRKPFGPPRC
jgi:hypothetical protein